MSCAWLASHRSTYQHTPKLEKFLLLAEEIVVIMLSHLLSSMVLGMPCKQKKNVHKPEQCTKSDFSPNSRSICHV